MKYNFVSISKKGLPKKQNEDSIAIIEIDDGILCVVCDGLGGETAADKASALSVTSIKDYFLKSDEINHLTKIRNAIKYANERLYDTAKSKKEFRGMATTSDVFFLNNRTVYWGHTGDSRIYHLKNGRLYQLTKDHSFVQKLIDRGYISMRDAGKHPSKNIILNALGERLDIDIDTSKLVLNSRDQHRFMICTDGVNTVLTNKELEKSLNKDMGKCIESMDKKIQSRGAPDDYSIIIVEHID